MADIYDLIDAVHSASCSVGSALGDVEGYSELADAADWLRDVSDGLEALHAELEQAAAEREAEERIDV